MAGCGCGGNGGISLLYACSGAANTGLLSDSVARKLRDAGAGRMTCLAGLGADLSGFVESAKCADRNIVIDGCAVGCGKKIFERLGLEYEQYLMTDFGVEKGKTEITDEVVQTVSAKTLAQVNAYTGNRPGVSSSAASGGCCG